MGYVEDNLGPNETVRYRAQLHWIIFVPHIILMLFLIGFVTILILLIRKQTTEIAVTSKRLIIKAGLISRKTIELKLDKLETLQVDQGILGRVCNYGTIRVVGTGGTNEPFKQVAAPLDLRKAINAALSQRPPAIT